MDIIRGKPEPLNSLEMGWKDTVMARPDHITRIIAMCDLPGLYA